MFKKILKNIWKEITRVREIQIISYETETEEHERLYRELYKQIIHYREKNSKRIFEKLYPIVTEDFIKKHGYIPSDEKIRSLALKVFCFGIKNGDIDSYLYEVK